MATKLKAVDDTTETVPLQGLALLRMPFPPELISKLPKETKQQSEQRKADRTKGVNCSLCGGWHHKAAIHIDYVGHAALTDRLLDADPEWSWEPAALTPEGLPAFDPTGGLWIKLTVCGVTRLGYGHAAAKPNQDPGSREKEVIGDALRNAAMRFGAALDLWSKVNLHAAEDEGEKAVTEKREDPPKVDAGPCITDEQRDMIQLLADTADIPLKKICERYGIEHLTDLLAVNFDGCKKSLLLSGSRKPQPPQPSADIIDDNIPF